MRAFTGIKDLDMIIFQKLDDSDIKNLSSVNKYTNSLLESEIFFRNRVILKYSKFLDEFKHVISWKEYYKEIYLLLKSEYPYYISAKALEDKRYDIIQILEGIKGIRRVKKFEWIDSQGYLINGCSRDGTPGGILEGTLVFLYPSEKLKCMTEYRNSVKIGTEKVWDENGFLENINIYDQGILLSNIYFIEGEKIREIMLLENGNHVTRNYRDGKIFFETEYRVGYLGSFNVRTKIWENEWIMEKEYDEFEKIKSVKYYKVE